jgi:hypothetical protein
MVKPRIGYLLIALLIWAQFDDAWVSDSAVSSSPVAADDDEYLPSEGRQHSEQSAPRQTPAQVGLNPSSVDFFSIRRSPASGSELAVAFGRSQLYVFMSLQC